ncbi:MAG TPA: hypothetical protein VGE12_22420, partial [Noviherbaspirillum sp.]
MEIFLLVFSRRNMPSDSACHTLKLPLRPVISINLLFLTRILHGKQKLAQPFVFLFLPVNVRNYSIFRPNVALVSIKEKPLRIN